MIIDRKVLTEIGYQIHQNILLEEVLKLVNDENIVSCSDGKYAIVQDGINRDSLDTSWHIDGLSHKNPPSIVVLFCENAGRGDITTELADVTYAITKLNPEIKNKLENIESCYLTRTGDKHFCSPLIKYHTKNDNSYLALNSRGWVKSDKLTLEEVVTNMSELFKSLNPTLTHFWNSGDCLVFDNLKFVHKRNNISKLVDPERRIFRFWIA